MSSKSWLSRLAGWDPTPEPAHRNQPLPQREAGATLGTVARAEAIVQREAAKAARENGGRA